MRNLFIILAVLFLGNCSTLFYKPELRVAPLCDIGNKISGLDYSLLEIKIYPKNHKVDKLKEKIKEYEKERKDLLMIGLPNEETEKLISIIQNRIDSIRFSLASRAEREGDIFSGQYNFSKAIESYQDAIYEVSSADEKSSTAYLLNERLQKKIQVTRENGENFLNNRVKALIDQAIYLNLDDQVSNAKSAMKQAKYELETSIFTNPKIVSLYSEQASVMNMYNKSIESNCRTTIPETILNQKKNILPNSFKTKSGIMFTKILTKEGKPIYVSEVIRPNEADSWYFARNYAEKLNNEENCPDCYQLPEFADIENIKVNKNYEGLWLKSWSPAPVGMTAGNVWFGFYTFDFLHDVIFHPLTWQSYIYPISPDSAWSRGGSWGLDGRPLRSAYRLNVVRDSDLGFRLVRPLR